MHPSTRLLRIAHAATLATCALAQAPLPTEDPPVTDLHPMLRETIERFREDELEHRDTAIAHEAEETPGYEALAAVIKKGSKLAIWLSERV